MFCICYATIGVPIAISLLARIGKKLYLIDGIIFNKLITIKDASYRKFARLVFELLISHTFIVIIPTGMFYWFEDWDFLTAWYYTVITVSSIGFGDYVAGMISLSL